MNIYGKNIRTLLVMLLFSSVAMAQTVEEEATTPVSDSLNMDQEEIKTVQKKNWSQIFTDRAVLFYDRALMGEESGVYTSNSGFVGNAGVLMIRGLSTVNLNAAPYVVIDGMPVRQTRTINPFVSGLMQSNTGFLNPLDIAGLRVLKNGYDGSFYGGKAGNGLIDIQIDKGVPGSTTIDLMARVGITQADYSLNMMSAEEFRPYLYSMMLDKGMSLPELQNNILFDPNHNKYNHNTNWMDEFKRNGLFHDYQLKMKGGDGDTRYMFSLGYASEDETIESSNYQRFSMRFNLDYRITPKIRVSNYLAYNYGTMRFFGEGTDWDVNPVYLAATKAPFMSRYQFSDDGVKIERLAELDVLGKGNPALFKDNLKNRSSENRVDAIVKGTWDIDKHTSLNTDFIINYSAAIEHMNRLSEGLPVDQYRLRQNAKRNYSEYMMRWNIWLGRNGNITPDLTYHSGLGFIYEKNEEKMAYGRRVNAATDDFESLKTGLSDSIDNMDHKHNLLTFYLNGKLNYRNSITLGANVYVEGSSNFGAQSRWTVYGGVDLGIKILEAERNYLGIYGQWGRTGNNDIRGSYQYQMYRPTQYLGFGGAYLGNVENDKLKPELTDNYDFGINTRLLDNLFEITAGYYYRKTSGLFTQKATPVEVGLDPQYENNGDMVNQGAEISVKANIVQHAQLQWSVFANISTLKNEITRLNNGDIIRSLDKFTGIARKGEKVGSFYGYKVKGVFKTTADVNLAKADGTPYQAGDYQIEDIDNNGMINSMDRQVIGSPIPDFYGGFGTNLSFKGLTLSALFSYSYGNDVYNLFDQKLHSMSDLSNQSVDVLDRWISEEQPGKGWLPRAAYGDPSDNFACSDKWVEDGSYLRLKAVSLSYDIPLRKRSGFIKGIKVFANGNNLFTVSGYKGFDPEVFSSVDPLLRGVDTGTSPTPKSYIFGVKISL